ncbi:hypothetical protein CEXT_792031 [Caerostris extrusa]|uniref:Uncharacterized protein n=1 Tax=Caerostris extrusa TaxID=172846 RepID=A0AAV4MDE8_CAEEX|nr:hypothetical protein CEXT_792031 [Caerostris extrusa]
MRENSQPIIQIVPGKHHYCIGLVLVEMHATSGNRALVLCTLVQWATHGYEDQGGGSAAKERFSLTQSIDRTQFELSSQRCFLSDLINELHYF